ncbi:nodulin-26 [Lathyrus oleraceus]|uniref:Nodulin-26 n=1 Tax=Pisum sativum TaxID=3888 RepID=A0A9D4ZTI2_PEA|nr:nodulin-26-like [Pisum sativum]KAI5384862.1 Nodulin-26 [Pisum sativum]
MANDNSARVETNDIENNHIVLDVNKDSSQESQNSYVPFLQKLIAEVVGTYFLIFAGCASIIVNKNHDNVVTLPGIAIVWGLTLLVLIYSLGHISGAHFNPAVTIAFATTRRFPLIQVPAYILAQLLGGTLASGTLKLIFSGTHDQFSGTLATGSNFQAFALEFIVTFHLMFTISAVATDNRAIGELAGIAVGSTLLLNVLIAGPITGASMNPVRSLGPAFVHNEYRGIWIFIISPILGAVAGAWVYNLVRHTNKPLREITKSASFLKETKRGGTK